MKKDALFLVRMDEVPMAGIERESALDAEWVAPRVAPTYRNSEKNIQVAIQARAVDDNLEVQVHLQGQLLFDCSRCAEDSPMSVDFDASGLFIPEARHRLMLEDVEMDAQRAENVYPYVEGTVDLEPLVTDLLALSLKDYPVCSESCKGLCPECGANLNTEPCDCNTQKVDPRWEALAGLKKKLTDKA